MRLLRGRQAKQALLPFGEVVNLPTIQAQCPKGHVLNVTYHQGEKDITFRCPHCKADYRLRLPPFAAKVYAPYSSRASASSGGRQ